MNPRILLADDHVIVRDGLRSLLEKNNFSIVAEASDGQTALQLVQQFKPDVAVLDLAMPVLNGLDAARLILQSVPKMNILLLTMHSEDHYVLEALKAGIGGYVLKTRAAACLIEAIREVTQGHIYLSPGVSRAVVDAFRAKTDTPVDPLSPRERQVLQLVAEGQTTKEIAAQLNVSTKTAESHRSRIMEKLDLHDTASLVRYAIRKGIIQAAVLWGVLLRTGFSQT